MRASSWWRGVAGDVLPQQEQLGFEETLDAVSEAVFVLDEDGRCRYVNEAAARLLGSDRDQVLGRSMSQAATRAIDPALALALQRALRQQPREHVVERYVDACGALCLVRAIRSSQGLTIYCQASATDTCTVERASAQLQALAHLGERVLTPGEPDQLITASLDALRTRAVLADATYLSDPAQWRPVPDQELVPVCSQGHSYGAIAVHRSAVDDDFLTSVASLLGTALHREHEERKARWGALHDLLTRLPNRVLAAHVLMRAPAQRAFVLAIRIAELDVMTSTYGLPFRDQLVQVVARRLRARLDMGDTLAEIDRGKFLVIADSVRHEAGALQLALQLQEAVATVVEIDDRKVLVSALVGIACREEGMDAEMVISHAEAGLARALALESGVAVFDEPFRRHSLAHFSRRHEMQRALDNDEFRVFYQPVVDLSDRTLVGVEALVRWAHPERGLLSPAEFIDVAEASGLIVPMGAWVLQTAVQQMAAWNTPSARPFVCVNVSARQLASADFAAVVTDLIRAGGLAHGQLGLEITESTVMDRTEAPMSTLNQLKEAGVKILIDDFGTGFSSLSYLKTLPVDVVKIDRSFVEDVDVDRRDAAIVQSIIAMTTAVGISTVAEGVETEAQHRALVAMNCPRAQGFLYSRPLSAEALQRTWL